MKVSGDRGGKARANRPDERRCDAAAAIFRNDGAGWIVFAAAAADLAVTRISPHILDGNAHRGGRK